MKFLKPVRINPIIFQVKKFHDLSTWPEILDVFLTLQSSEIPRRAFLPRLSYWGNSPKKQPKVVPPRNFAMTSLSYQGIPQRQPNKQKEEKNWPKKFYPFLKKVPLQHPCSYLWLLGKYSKLLLHPWSLRFTCSLLKLQYIYQKNYFWTLVSITIQLYLFTNEIKDKLDENKNFLLKIAEFRRLSDTPCLGHISVRYRNNWNNELLKQTCKSFLVIIPETYYS